MRNAMILDCTLRDGGYLVDKRFGDNVIRGIVSGLVRAGIDCIEVGFFQDEGFGDGKTVFRDSRDAGRFIPGEKNGSIFAVLADYSRYSIENLDDRMPGSVDAVRECFFKHERDGAVEACGRIAEKGYMCFVQPVDILGYGDGELVDLIERVNAVEPYCFSIVDTFGSMYQEDLRRVFEIVHHNLAPGVRVGFHSHNNLQLSSALSQEFVRMSYGKREVVVDGTIAGMGRGAGNTPTELVAQYLASRMGYSYDIDALLDVMDDYMGGIRSRCSWGYSTPYFIAGSYGAHVNNVAYLTEKNSIRNRDIRYILNKIGPEKRKRYDYGLLEREYIAYQESDVDDSGAMEALASALAGRSVLVLVPGRSAASEAGAIRRHIEENGPVVISVNFLHDEIESDYVYMSNVRRYSYWSQVEKFARVKKILASNIAREPAAGDETIVSFNRLVKCGWQHVDNSTLMLLRLLDGFELESLAIAGFDGYDYGGRGSRNYAAGDLEVPVAGEDPAALNKEISEMLADFMENRRMDYPIGFVTPSRFEKSLGGVFPGLTKGGGASGKNAAPPMA